MRSSSDAGGTFRYDDDSRSMLLLAAGMALGGVGLPEKAAPQAIGRGAGFQPAWLGAPAARPGTVRSTELRCRPCRGLGLFGSVFPGLPDFAEASAFAKATADGPSGRPPRSTFWRPLRGLGCG